jgi:hypothetical protein
MLLLREVRSVDPAIVVPYPAFWCVVSRFCSKDLLSTKCAILISIEKKGQKGCDADHLHDTPCRHYSDRLAGLPRHTSENHSHPTEA